MMLTLGSRGGGGLYRMKLMKDYVGSTEQRWELSYTVYGNVD